MKRVALVADLRRVCRVGIRAQAAPASNDYSLDANWLCRPDRQDACAIDLRTTIVKADGSFSREGWKG